MTLPLRHLRFLVALLVTLLPLSWAGAPTVALAAATSAAEAEHEGESEPTGFAAGATALACVRAERRFLPPAPVPLAPPAPHRRLVSPRPARAPRLALAAEMLPYRHWRRDNGIGRSLLM